MCVHDTQKKRKGKHDQGQKRQQKEKETKIHIYGSATPPWVINTHTGGTTANRLCLTIGRACRRSNRVESEVYDRGYVRSLSHPRKWLTCSACDTCTTNLLTLAPSQLNQCLQLLLLIMHQVVLFISYTACLSHRTQQCVSTMVVSSKG